MIPEKLNQITEQVIGAAIEVHKYLGPGLLESAYQKALAYEFDLIKLDYILEKEISVIYKGKNIGKCFRLDFVVSDKVVVELKSVENIIPIHKAQLISYLKLSKLRLGLLINFNVNILKDGVKRIAN